jgi:hypothetical protein
MKNSCQLKILRLIGMVEVIDPLTGHTMEVDPNEWEFDGVHTTWVGLNEELLIMERKRFDRTGHTVKRG